MLKLDKICLNQEKFFSFKVENYLIEDFFKVWWNLSIGMNCKIFTWVFWMICRLIRVVSVALWNKEKSFSFIFPPLIVIQSLNENCGKNLFSFCFEALQSYLLLLRACDTQEINKFDWFQISRYLCLKYIKFSFQNLGNGREDKNGRK